MISPKKVASCQNSWHSMIDKSLLQSCGEYLSQINSEMNTWPQRTLEQKTRIFTDNKEGLHATLAWTRSRWVPDISSHKTFTISSKKIVSCQKSRHSMINESLLQSCGEYHSQTNPETNTRPQRKLEQKTRVFIDYKEAQHAKHGLAHSMYKRVGVSGWQVG